VYQRVVVHLDRVNSVEVKANPNIIKENYEPNLQNCVPRPEPGYFRRARVKKGRVPWSFPKSLFKDYIPDTEVRCPD
jgi:hypothetical protein